MEKEELLNFLLNNISCFDGVTLDDFRLLNSLESDELGLMNDTVIKVTPLLKQISDYALIVPVLDENELGEISAYIDEDNNMLDETIKIIEACYEYIRVLKSENCNHPSVLITSDLVNGLTSYSKFNENICDLIELIENSNFQDSLLDLSIPTIDNLLDVTGAKLKKVITKIKKKIITNKEELLLALSNYARDFSSIIILASKCNNIYHFNKSNVLNVDNGYIHIFANDVLVPNRDLTSLDIINNLATIIEKTEEYEDEHFYEIDDEQKTKIDELKEAYNFYESYKYKYLKDNYREHKLLEKCKKM